MREWSQSTGYKKYLRIHFQVLLTRTDVCMKAGLYTFAICIHVPDHLQNMTTLYQAKVHTTISSL
jgi:hypothetical protein